MDLSTLLEHAAETGDLEQVSLITLIPIGKEALNNAFSAAVRKGKIDTVKHLLSLGADVNTVDEGYPPMVKALLIDNSELFQLLLCHGGNPNLHTESGLTPLRYAVKNSRSDLLEALIHHPQTDIRGANLSDPYIHLTVEWCTLDFVKDFLGADTSLLSIRDYRGHTPLRRAIHNQNFEQAKFLLEKDPISMDDVDRFGLTGYQWLVRMHPFGKHLSTVRSSEVLSGDPDQEVLRKTISDVEKDSCRMDDAQQAEILGRAYLGLNDDVKARRFFGRCFDTQRVTCNVCSQNIIRVRNVCRRCADVDLCIDCYSHYGTQGRTPCKDHEFLVVDASTSDESLLLKTTSDQIQQ